MRAAVLRVVRARRGRRHGSPRPGVWATCPTTTRCATRRRPCRAGPGPRSSCCGPASSSTRTRDGTAILGALHRLFGLGRVDLVHRVGRAAVRRLLARPDPRCCGGPRRGSSLSCSLNIVDPGKVVRAISGRPFLVSSAIVPLVLLLWPRLEERRGRGALRALRGGGARSCWVHGSYYLLAVPVVAVLAAAVARPALRLAAAFAVGIVSGAAADGPPGRAPRADGPRTATCRRGRRARRVRSSPSSSRSTDMAARSSRSSRLLAWRGARRPGALAAGATRSW